MKNVFLLIAFLLLVGATVLVVTTDFAAGWLAGFDEMLLALKMVLFAIPALLLALIFRGRKRKRKNK